MKRKTIPTIAKVIGGVLLSSIGISDYANKKELSGTPKIGKWYQKLRA